MNANRLEAWDLPTQARQWSVGLGNREVVLGARTAYICASTGELSAHDLATGALRWEHGPGSCGLGWRPDVFIVESAGGDTVVTTDST
ncbi:hypothetical protein [Nannocystis exedens]|uniref:hypothetical protein n=1 Tax=Nannocystis exedens TaxID=54 RepID=UPI001160D7FD|nr:hypothetical protein [Nannocystis exedens]